MRETHATYKLGIEFVGWSGSRASYLHPFGRYGFPSDGISFQHRWLKAKLAGLDDDFEEYSLNTVCARAGKFQLPSNDQRSLLATMGYAYHFDAGLYARYLRTRSEAAGVRRHEGKVTVVDQHPETGFVTGVHSDKGHKLEGDLFIDCSGIRGLLIEGILKIGFEDWSRWLPCDRAVAVQSAKVTDPIPYTRASAQAAGWQWRIPLQHRTGNGYVYSSSFLEDDDAATVLAANLDAPALGDPRIIKFRTGRRRFAWCKNVVAIGLSSGFLEPLESTSIHMIQSGIAKLLSLFPARDCNPLTTQQYNRVVRREMDGIRDFLVLHYHSTPRPEPLWAHCREMELPEELKYKEDQFRSSGRIMLEPEDLFREASWFAVLMGQGHLPRDYNPLIDSIDAQENLDYLSQIKSAIRSAATGFPTHQSFLCNQP
jgi:tryptophan halogenase